MRIFVLFSRKAYTSSNFDLENLENFGRIDIIAQSLVQAICLSYGKREDVIFYAVMNGKPNNPITIEFVSKEMKKVFPNEKFFAKKIQKALSLYENLKKEELEVEEGIKLYKKDLIPILEMIKEKFNPKFFVLHEKGEFFNRKNFEINNCFILGDNLGIPHKIEKFVIKNFDATKISLGKISYLSSTCISLINHFLDRI